MALRLKDARPFRGLSGRSSLNPRENSHGLSVLVHLGFPDLFIAIISNRISVQIIA